MDSRFRFPGLRLLGALAALIALASCGGESTQEPTSTAATSTTTTSRATTAPSSTSTTSSSTTTVPSDTTEAAADFDIRVDADTEWGHVFDALTTTEQECVRDSFEGDLLEPVLARPVMSDSDTPEAWEVSMFSCLAPQTAQAVFLALLVAGMEEDGVFLIDADAEACLDEWVAGIDVVATIVALSADDVEAAAVVTTAFMRCNPDLFISLMLEETGLTLEDHTEEEANCLREWAAGIDWATLLTRSADDPSLLGDFVPDLITCAPDLFISSMLEETDLTLEDLSEEEANCLREWAAGIDWATVLTGFADDALYLFELLECLPDLSWSEPGDLPWDEVIDEATPVGVDVALQGELEDEGDSDYFTFEAEEGEFYQLDVTLGTLPDSVLEILDADGNWLDANDDYGDSTASRLIWPAPATSPYFVRVTGAGTGTYTLTIAFSDIADDHPNSADNATPVEIGVSTQGELEYNLDRDFFTFEATAGEYYRLDVTLGTLQDSALAILGTDGNWLDTNYDYGEGTTSWLLWLAPTTGTYHVEVTSYNFGTTGTYTLTITTSDTEDDHPNTIDNATPVEIGVSTQGELEYSRDRDFFTFEATAAEYYELEVTHGTLRHSIVDIFDAQGIWLHSGYHYGTSPASRLIWPAPHTGTYYVRVTGSDPGTYTLTITVIDIVDDHLNSTANATPVEIGVSTQGDLEYESDVDFFAFEATAGQLYELDVTLGTLQDSILEVFDSNGNQLDSNDDYGDSTASRLIWLAPSTGTYYVDVISLAGGALGTGTYTLTIAFSDIADDHPNSADNATPVEIGVSTQGELEYNRDSDFFTFEATAGEYYRIDVTLGTLQDSALEILDADGIWLDANDDYGDSRASLLIWHAPATGTYYVLVHSFGASAGTYTLTVANA